METQEKLKNALEYKSVVEKDTKVKENLVLKGKNDEIGRYIAEITSLKNLVKSQYNNHTEQMNVMQSKYESIKKICVTLEKQVGSNMNIRGLYTDDCGYISHLFVAGHGSHV